MKARHFTFVARRAIGQHQNAQRISIAINRYRNDALRVARGLTFVPELRARTRPKPCLAGLDGAAKTLFIHVRERQHLARLHILHNGRHQAVLVKSNFIKIHLTVTPCARK